MRLLLFVYFCLSVLLILNGCGKDGSTITRGEVCTLVSKEDVQSIQGALVNETKSSEQIDGVFLVSQCFYRATEFSKSVNLALVQKNPNRRDQRSPRDFWKEKFREYGKPETKTGGEQETETTPPKKIAGLGDDAYWVGNRLGGVLYVLKGDCFISIGLGGTDDEETKLKKSEMLVKKALQRL